MDHPYYEIVTYAVTHAKEADQARKDARERLQGFPGFIAWDAFRGAADATLRVDLMTWRSLAEAEAAGAIVGAAPEFAAFRSSIKNLAGMDHYLKDETRALPIATGNGIECGRFRIKAGVSENEMRRAYQAMVDGFLAKQPGWRRQHLVKLEGGLFMDLAFAESGERAKAICASWHESDLCRAFLALIEPEDMNFGIVL